MFHVLSLDLFKNFQKKSWPIEQKSIPKIYLGYSTGELMSMNRWIECNLFYQVLEFQSNAFDQIFWLLECYQIDAGRVYKIYDPTSLWLVDHQFENQPEFIKISLS